MATWALSATLLQKSFSTANVLEEVYGRAPYRTRLCGSIAALSVMLEQLGIHATMFGFIHHDENLHSPNEFFRLEAFRKGQTAYARLLEALRV